MPSRYRANHLRSIGYRLCRVSRIWSVLPSATEQKLQQINYLPHVRRPKCAYRPRTRVWGALTSLHADVAHPWTVASLAEEARLSRTVFSERFTRLVGMPPMAYLIKWRMAVAKDILQRERLPQDVVAATVGYQSASAFSTAFRREVGQAPGEYARTFFELAV
ncbi:MAG TPA: AraC family transcriptional regulator [Bradyrhizobium sp.]|nr:AraC family transcriptional regulator [Bradyrhizobium sp.]